MAEIGNDIAARRPKRLTVEMQLHADWAVTMGCGDAWPYVPTRVEDWDISDPAHQPLEVVSEIRDEVEQRVTRLIHERLDEIRADRTAHQLRLARLLPDLIAEFDGLCSPDEIRANADAILDDYDEANVRSFVAAIVNKRARECLRADECAVLAGR